MPDGIAKQRIRAIRGIGRFGQPLIGGLRAYYRIFFMAQAVIVINRPRPRLPDGFRPPGDCPNRLSWHGPQSKVFGFWVR